MPADLHAAVRGLTPALVALADMPLLAAWLGGLVLLPAALVAHGRAELPAAIRRIAVIAAALLALALLVKAGRFLLAVNADMPRFVWALGLVLCLLGMRRGERAADLLFGLLGLGCLAACVTLAAGWVFDTRLFDGALFLLGLLLDAPVLLVQWCVPTARNDRQAAPKTRPPTAGEASPDTLAQHLESDAAQEGADKYTRE